MKKIKTGSDFSGVGAFDYAIERVCKSKGLKHERIYACDWDKFARITYAHNHGKPEYYPKDVYDREIPEESLDIYMTSPPCQAFSLAGKRKGKDDERGILFFNSHEFIKKNNPRFFIFENVKGLLSDDGGKTFQEWVNMLGGKSVNGVPILFPHEDSVPYHLYWKVLNSKKHGVPQNRERVFLIGIRDDKDNSFRFPKEERLTKKLKDVLESEVDKKYFLSDKMLKFVLTTNFREAKPIDINKNIAPCVKVGGDVSCFDVNTLKIKSATKKGFEVASENDSINFSFPSSEKRRGRVEKEVAQTLDTSCNQGVWIGDYRSDEGLRIRKDNCSPAVMAMMKDTFKTNFTGNNPPITGNSYSIRRLTPRECFRLQDFPDSFDFSVVSDSQAYKQAGNSITVRVLELILNNLPL